MFGSERAWKAHTINWLLLGLLLITLPVFGQSGKGVITGSVTDSSGAVLKGARVELLPAGVTGVTNSQGVFELRDITPGDYTLTTTYIGFKTHNDEISVAAGKQLAVNVKLEVPMKSEQILVTAERVHGEADAINETRTADNLIDVLPAEVITSLPNANVADAVGRMPGVALERIEGEGVYVGIRGLDPHYTNVTIDGITIPTTDTGTSANSTSGLRATRLDQIPADLVDSVEINKTLSASQDGDGIAGSVNLRSKMATDQPLFTAYGNGGYTPIENGRGVQQYGSSYGRRFGEKKQFGLIFGGTYDYNGRGIDNIQPALDKYSTSALPYYDSTTIRQYNYYRYRYGFNGSADWKLNDNNSFYAHGLWSDLKDWGDKWYYSPVSNPMTAAGAAGIPTGADKQAPTFYTSDKRPDVSTGVLSLGGRHVSRNSLLNWEIAAANSRMNTSAGNPKADFSWIDTAHLPNCNYIPLAPGRQNAPTFGCDQANSPLLDATKWALLDLTTSTGSYAELDLSAQASYARTYNAGGHFGTFETGFKIRNGHQYQDASENVYDGWTMPAVGSNSGLLMSNLKNSFENNSGDFYHGQYFGGKFGPVSDFDKAQDYVLENESGHLDALKTAAKTYPMRYDAVERITAGYAMNTIDFGKLHVQTGLRFEGTQMDTSGYKVDSATSKTLPVVTPVSNNPSYLDVLPSVQLKYSLTSNSVLRAVYSRGIVRPDAYQLVPYDTETDNGPGVVTKLAIGNPTLRPEHSNNYDLLYERYFHSLGMLQIGGFFKQLTAPELSLGNVPFAGVPAELQSTVLSYDPKASTDGTGVTMMFNGENAYVYGFELSYQQHFSMLPSVFKGLGFSGNYAYTDSQLKGIPGFRSDHPALSLQTKNTWNLGPTFDNKHISARVGLQYNGANIDQYTWIPSTIKGSNDVLNLGPKGPEGDNYTLPHMQLDAQVIYRIGRGLSAMVSGLNLTNEVFGYYIGNPVFVGQREYYKPQYVGGLHYTFEPAR